MSRKWAEMSDQERIQVEAQRQMLELLGGIRCGRYVVVNYQRSVETMETTPADATAPNFALTGAQELTIKVRRDPRYEP